MCQRLLCLSLTASQIPERKQKQKEREEKKKKEEAHSIPVTIFCTQAKVLPKDGCFLP